ncbi:energy transducer TonB [Sphingomonas sp. Leaf22]|uniref:energy transducer TonB n=1 Tax=Sphingomonas sp. Leaf22 TaxID=1735687 RepID=UPI0009E9F962|nr:energy transducer TonB [Sphingomonas sp. Leaf22]
MFGMLAIAAFGVVQGPAAMDFSQPPQLRNPQALITYEDYPTESLRRNEYGIVSIMITVSTDGKVSTCQVTESSGFATLDLATCSLFNKRAKFEPAKDAAGLPIEGKYRLSNSWGLEEHQPRTTIDVPLQVSSVPSDYRSPVKARLVFDATGHVTACEVTTTSGSVVADRAACAYIKQQLAIAAPKSASMDIPPVAVRYLIASLSKREADPSPKQ